MYIYIYTSNDFSEQHTLGRELRTPSMNKKYWLVVEPNPSEKYDFVTWDDYIFPTQCKNIFPTQKSLLNHQ